MRWLIEVLAERLRAALLADVAHSLEIDLIVRRAERRADLELTVARLEQAGTPAAAAGLRQQAEGVSADRPLAGVHAALEDLAADRQPAARPIPARDGQAGRPALPARRPGRK